MKTPSLYPGTLGGHTFLPVKDPESVINNVDLGGKANMYHKTFEGNSKKLEKKEDVWLNITGIGNSSHKYTFVRAIYLQGPGQQYLHYKCSSGRFRDVCFRMIPGVKPVMWEHCVSEDGRTVAVQFFYALSGNRMKVIFLSKGCNMTVKNLLDELSYKMARDNQASRLKKFKSVLHPNIVVRF